jgi:hypothetical protein
MEYIIQLEDTTKKLNKSDQDFISKNISELWEKKDAERKKQLDDIKTLEDRIFPKKKDKNKKYTSHEMFEMYFTFKAALWENLYSTVDGLYDVKGQDQKSKDNANIQKANLNLQFEKAKLQNELDKAIDFLIRKSEAIMHVGWKVEEKQIRRQEDEIVNILGVEINLGKKINTKTIKEYEGVCFKAIDPCHFVYDVDFGAFDIYRSYANVQQIKENKLFKASASVLKELEAKEQDKNTDDKKDKKAGQIEILEYWGDIKLKDETMIKNYVIVVADKKHILRFEPNPYLNRPFVKCNIVEDPETKRGYLYLLAILDLIESGELITNNMLDALEYIMNKPVYAPKGALTKLKDGVKPGDVIEYDPNLLNREPKTYDCESALKGWDFVNFFSDKKESTSGIYANMAGQQTRNEMTATQFEGIVGGQTSRQSMILDTINQNLIIPIIEDSADLIANYDFEDKEIAVPTSKGEEYEKVTDEVKQGNFKYLYGDRNAIQEKKLRFKEISGLITQMLSSPEMMQAFLAAGGSLIEIFKWAMETNGFDNLERFFNAEQIMQDPTGQLVQPPELGGVGNIPQLPQGINIPASGGDNEQGNIAGY